MKKSQRPIGRETSEPARNQLQGHGKRLNIDWAEVDRILAERPGSHDEETHPVQVEMPEGIKKLQQLYLGRPLE
jgi:hypothetical protein